jgi:hypothetical protein
MLLLLVFLTVGTDRAPPFPPESGDFTYFLRVADGGDGKRRFFVGLFSCTPVPFFFSGPFCSSKSSLSLSLSMMREIFEAFGFDSSGLDFGTDPLDFDFSGVAFPREFDGGVVVSSFFLAADGDPPPTSSSSSLDNWEESLLEEASDSDSPLTLISDSESDSMSALPARRRVRRIKFGIFLNSESDSSLT